MKQILLVEDSAMFGRLTKAKLEAVFDVPVYWVKTYRETLSLLNQAKDNFSMALLDFNLPDAQYGEVIDEVISRGISTFVFTSNITDEVRDLVWSKKVADYILKDDPNSLDYIIKAMSRLANNETVIVLVVGDTNEYRSVFSELLYVQKYRVLTARDGRTALSILGKYNGIKLVIAEYQLPDMDGWKFCQQVREKYKHDDLAIIGVIDTGGKEIGARFIKSGANDFLLMQSFMVEEFYCRVNQCVDTIKLIEDTKEAAIRDHLTGLFNRRYFFDAGENLFAHSLKDGVSPVTCAMVDIDFFKKVNDVYGHDAGDKVLVAVAHLLAERMGDSAITARFGGEEFCILTASLSGDEIEPTFEDIRKEIETLQVVVNDRQESLGVTISIGICAAAKESLEKLVKTADENLYNAKEKGRNRIEYVV